MSAINALAAAKALGVIIETDGADLMLAASAAPPAAVLENLKRYKTEIVAILKLKDRGPSAGDWLALFDELAGVLEFDSGQPRELAEVQAVGSCVLDPAMAETSSEVLEQFVRCLPAHIGRNRPSLVSDKNKDAPGGTADDRTTP